MRKLFLRLAVLGGILLALLYAFGDFFKPIWAGFDDPEQVRNSVRFYLMLGTATFVGLYFVRQVMTIIIILLLALLLFLLFQFGFFDLFNIIR